MNFSNYSTTAALSAPLSDEAFDRIYKSCVKKGYTKSDAATYIAALKTIQQAPRTNVPRAAIEARDAIHAKYISNWHEDC
jgi:hypothetical protein